MTSKVTGEGDDEDAVKKTHCNFLLTATFEHKMKTKVVQHVERVQMGECKSESVRE